MIEAIKFALRYDPSPNPRVGAVLVDKNNKIKKITAHKEKDKAVSYTHLTLPTKA